MELAKVPRPLLTATYKITLPFLLFKSIQLEQMIRAAAGSPGMGERVEFCYSR